MLLDVRGEICPYPMLKAMEALPKLAPGEALEVLTDHPPALQTIPAYTSRLGYRSRIQEVASGVWKVIVEKVVEEKEAAAPQTLASASKEVVGS